MEAVFLGLNDAGEEVYSWLNRRDDIEVKALLTEKQQLSLIKDIEPDLVISGGFEHKVPEEIIEVPEKGIVNLHPSFLPYNRGAHPYIWPIIEDTPAGVSIHYMTEEIDEGAIIDREEVSVLPDDTAKTLRNRLMDAQVRQFKRCWPDIKDGAEGKEQRLENGSVHYSNELEEVREIDTEEKMKAGELIKKLRGLTYPPQKLAYFEENNERYFVEVEITPERELD